AMEDRLRREAETARRNRPFTPDAGTGLIITAVILLLVSSLFPLALPIRLGLWLAGLLAAAVGFARMRFDGDAIRRTGFILAAAAIGLVALVITRGTPPPDTAGLFSTATPDATPIAAATPLATPAAQQVTGSVPA